MYLFYIQEGWASLKDAGADFPHVPKEEPGVKTILAE